ncbi:MAG: AAA family ATPase [Euryarchaeota archaeon]|nr:AAA family ATPase [Euryarchaeota archaeon]
MEDERVPTGIDGFDELCGGGLPKGRTYLLSGTSGAGKTIFALQYLYNGAVKYNEPGIFVATEERPEEIRRNARKFHWDFPALEKEGKLAIIDGTSMKLGLASNEKYVDIRPFDMRHLTDQIITVQAELNAKRAVVDSSTSIGFHIGDPQKIRIELLKLSTTLEVAGITTFLTCEILDQNNLGRFGVENFVTHGAIALYFKRAGNTRVRSIEIFKLRGTPHDTKVHPFDITPNGIQVHPHEEIYGGD